MAEFEMLNAGNSEAQEKGALSALFAQSAGWMAATGVLEGLAVTQTPTASGSVLIASGSAVVQPTITAGASLLVCNSQKTLDIFTANPMGGLPRNDIVEFDSLTALISVRVGTPNATPTDPTVPNTSVALARLRHMAGTTIISTSQIDPLIVFTTLRGVTAARVSVNAELTTNSAGFYAANTALLSAPSITGDGVKKFRITASFMAMTGTVAGDWYDMFIRDSTTAVNLKTYRVPIVNTGIGSTNGVTIVTVDTPSAGSHIYQLAGQRSGGSGVANIVGSTTAPIEIIVEQIA